ncbi:MAG: 30S ribosomal protein S20 [Myxococcales bacterium]|nr:30S ribosomal protein S20 [Myxococcales bacterium]
MPNHKSAIKRMRQNEKRRQRNRHYKSRVKHSIRAVHDAIESQEFASIEETLRHAISEIAHASTKGVLPKKRASRKISRLTIAVNKARKAAEG